MAPAEQPNPEDELRQLRQLINHLPGIVGYWDRNLRNVIANDAYLSYFAMAPHQVHGRHIREVLGETVYALNLPYIMGALAGRPQLFERELVGLGEIRRRTLLSYIPDIVDGEVLGFYIQGTDLTEEADAERALDDGRRLFEISMANAPYGKAVVTTTGEMLLANPALCALIGYSADELVGRDYRDFVHPDDVAAGEQEMASLLAGTVTQISSERRYVRRDGSVIWMQRSAVLVPGRLPGAEDLVIAQFQDVTARRHAEAELARLAVTDQLTGLFNRRALVSRVAEHQAGRPWAAVGLIFIDLDGFKHVNDTHGHATGDVVLAEVARRLSDAVCEPNSAYRLGGDEFVVLVPDAAHDTEVGELAAAVRSALTGRYTADSSEFGLTASVGWTWGHDDNAEELIRKADIDMYRQKARLGESDVRGNPNI
ncbi:diguanylate cyclase [Mycobacterium crocinum]|uniref:Diguanylate cyclase n=1 Tax=Mycolicibacterium crocinum TaxID=388459 RepID=A0ABY3TD22_9MYCO|nr:diguanylate cyclase [Mycolicibacterium crocinum]MCV7214121.1 diguanylate cyclase [Mycolicibacterium crocinum]ULN39332.1 diguanylate cyclase [Mycolicibacterium crocinum]